jgi:SAM-dependent methyltransferase
MSHFTTMFVYDAPPPGETLFRLGHSGAYRREVRTCRLCGHFVSVHDMGLGNLYEGGYVDATYGAERLRERFDRIVSLPEGQSDNRGRVESIVGFAAAHLHTPRAQGRPPDLLDVGSGLGVFPYEMRRAGWRCLALDPDVRAVEHCRAAAGVSAVCGDFSSVEPALVGSFDVLTFNKVLEHSVDPASMLARAALFLRPGGFVYIELPDGQAAAVEGPGREEFFIEHLHVFSPASLAMLASRAGLSPLTTERLREPSGKLTLRAFLVPSPTSRQA